MSSCSQRPDMSHLPISSDIDYTPYAVQAGKHAFRPWPIILYRHRDLDTLTYHVLFDESCMYDMKGDLDQLDWSKGAGLSLNWRRNEKDALMWAWRNPHPESEYLDLTVYYHRDYERFWGYEGEDVLLKAKPFQPLRIDFIRQGNKKWKVDFFNLEEKTERSVVVELRTNPVFSRRINPWFGGADNAPGPFGGVAPNDMVILMNSKAEL
jgi:hypothetical protein